jgi:hypothetical protein
MDAEVRIDETSLVRQRRPRIIAAGQRHGKVLHEIAEHRRRLAAIDLRQPADVGQRVEQEVRRELGLKHPQARVSQRRIRRHVVDLGTDQCTRRGKCTLAEFEDHDKYGHERAELAPFIERQRHSDHETRKRRLDAREYTQRRADAKPDVPPGP